MPGKGVEVLDGDGVTTGIVPDNICKVMVWPGRIALMNCFNAGGVLGV